MQYLQPTSITRISGGFSPPLTPKYAQGSWQVELCQEYKLRSADELVRDMDLAYHVYLFMQFVSG